MNEANVSGSGGQSTLSVPSHASPFLSMAATHPKGRSLASGPPIGATRYHSYPDPDTGPSTTNTSCPSCSSGERRSEVSLTSGFDRTRRSLVTITPMESRAMGTESVAGSGVRTTTAGGAGGSLSLAWEGAVDGSGDGDGSSTGLVG